MSAVQELPLPIEAEGQNAASDAFAARILQMLDVIAESRHQAAVKRLLEQVLPLAPGLEGKLRAGICVLDVGCGKGSALLRLAREFPRSRFMGYDLCEHTIAQAQALASELHLTNLAFYRYDAAGMRDEAAFDLVTTFDAIREQKDPSAVLSNIYRVLKRGGTFLMQDIAGSSCLESNADHLAAPLLNASCCSHCMSVSLSEGGAGLGTMWGKETAERMLQEAGFHDVHTGKVPQDTMYVYYVCEKE